MRLGADGLAPQTVHADVGVQSDGWFLPARGVKAKALAALASSLRDIKQPRVVVGDWNRAPQLTWQRGWPKHVGGKVKTWPGDARACFRQGFARP